MRKYSFEFKKKVVKDYLEGKEGYKRLRKKYGMPDTSNTNMDFILQEIWR